MATNRVIPIKKITSWSFSRYSSYKACPAAAKYKFIDKLKEPQNDAMARGEQIHKLAEDYTKGSIKKLPGELKLFKDDFTALKKQPALYVEESWTFKSDWSETQWNDWNGAWLRVKMDVAYINTEHNVLVPVDHKTGKYSDWKLAEYEEQLELYSLAGLKKFPHVEAASPRLWFLDHGIVHPDPAKEEIFYTRDQESYLDKLWREKTYKMLNDTVFKPTPGDACRWCHFKKENGGPCRF